MKQTLKYILSVIMENLKFAETKHSVIIALNGAVIVLSVNFFNGNSLIINILNWLAIFFCGLSIYISFFAMMSRNIIIKKKRIKVTKNNLIYFKDLAEMSYVELLKQIVEDYGFPKDYKTDGFDEDLSKTIIANAKVTNTKFVLFNKSMFCLILGLLCALVMFSILGYSL